MFYFCLPTMGDFRDIHPKCVKTHLLESIDFMIILIDVIVPKKKT